MATKTALEFVFNADQLLSVCKPGQDVLVTSYLEEVLTQGGQPVGAMRVKAVSKPGDPNTVKIAAPASGDVVYGCPIPPCVGT